MIRWGLAALVLLTAACGPTRQTYRDLDQLGADYAAEGASPLRADTCHMADHHNLLGVDDTALTGMNLPQGTRVLGFGRAAPVMDTPSRLNIQVGADHKVTSMRCG